MNRTVVLVADSVPLFRTGARNLLRREGDFDVVEAGRLDELVEVVSAHAPDIALIDFDLPPEAAIDARAWLAAYSSTQSILWSFSPSGDAVLAALRSGARGYLHKAISPRGLVRALRGIAAGEAPLARDLAALMIDGLHGMQRRVTAREQASVLSAREREVLRLIAAGARNKEIAEKLLISEFTVKRHVQNILHKLELPSRRAAAGFYRVAFDDSVSAAVGQPA